MVVVDYGMGNLASARRAFEECGASVEVSADPAALESADRVVIPGVGSFLAAMERLRSVGWPAALRSAVFQRKVPAMGICLGMQLLAEHGVEGGTTEGLGLVPGRVAALTAPVELRLPHVGWNSVHFQSANRLFDGIPDGTDFYFVHSYEFIPENQADSVASTSYGSEFVSAIEHDHVFGVQFHPEKSSRQGLQLIRNFLYG